MTSWQPAPYAPSDVEASVVAGLTDLLDPVKVSTSTVGWARGERRVIVAVSPGIPAAGPRGFVVVTITSAAESKEEANDLARAAHAAMLGLPTVSGGVQSVREQQWPYPIPTADAVDGIARYAASYLVLVAGTPV